MGSDRGLKAIWYLAPGHPSEPDVLYAGIQPAGLFASRDRGASWEPINGLNEHPTRDTWQPAKGGLALHSIYVDPRDARRIYAAVSAGGVYRSDDGGTTWKNMLDDLDAEPGVVPWIDGVGPDPAKTVIDQDDGGDEEWLWLTPKSKFPEGSYLIRIEGYRSSESLHYSQHMEKIYVNR